MESVRTHPGAAVRVQVALVAMGMAAPLARKGRLLAQVVPVAAAMLVVAAQVEVGAPEAATVRSSLRTQVDLQRARVGAVEAVAAPQELQAVAATMVVLVAGAVAPQVAVNQMASPVLKV